jgi:WD40 repeat protein
MISLISSSLLLTSNPPSLRDLTTNTLIKIIFNRSLRESLSQVAPGKVTGDVIELLRKALIQRYRVLLLNITSSCLSTVLIGDTHGAPVVFSSDSKYALTASYDTTALLWDIEDINNLQSHFLNSHTREVQSVAFSPDGQFALTGSWGNQTAYLWDIKDKKNIQSYVLNDHTDNNIDNDDIDDDINNDDIDNDDIDNEYAKGGITSVAFSSDHKYALTGSFHGTLRLWDIQETSILWKITSK